MSFLQLEENTLGVIVGHAKRAASSTARWIGRASAAHHASLGTAFLGLGAAIYLVSPWRPGDWLAVLVTVIGGGMVVEGALILAFGDNFLAFARRLMGAANRLWAVLSLLLGAALIVAALLRL